MTEISKEYAAALFELALERDELDDVRAGLSLFRELVSGTPEYLEFLSSPAIPLVQRLDELKSALEGSVCTDVLSFLSLLCEHGRIKHVLDCIEGYEELYNIKRRIKVAHVTAGAPLTDEQLTRLTEKLERREGCSIVLDVTVDESVIGGISVDIDGTLIDGTVRSRLKAVKSSIDS